MWKILLFYCRIRTKQLEVLKGNYVLVGIDFWSITSRYPTGHYVKVLGPIGDVETETEGPKEK